MKRADFQVVPEKRVDLSKWSTRASKEFPDKEAAKEKLAADISRMAELQDVFYADNRYSLLIVFQALDAAGKDGAIKHVMSGLNPQGCRVASFKSPSSEELSHDYLWRCIRQLPERGHIGIFNRSYYEEVLVVRVHPNFLAAQRLPEPLEGDKFWQERFEQINHFEKYLVANGTRVLKFYLHLSKQEQKKRFLERIDRPEKNWKLSSADLKERGRWDDYQAAYAEMLAKTSTKHAPWHVVPADQKWFARTVIADVIVRELESLPLQYPQVDEAGRKNLAVMKEQLLAEPD
jgi:PPK2 family polyphosphate:nucleotide phosphotransferase